MPYQRLFCDRFYLCFVTLKMRVRGTVCSATSYVYNVFLDGNAQCIVCVHRTFGRKRTLDATLPSLCIYLAPNAY